MTVHIIDIHEGAQTKDAPAPAITLDIREYVVSAESGIVKRGRLWKKGERIELERRCAVNFMAVGDVTEG